MNILMLSVGTRNKLVQYFKDNMKPTDRLICTDYSRYAPAIYEGDKFYTVPPIHDENYIDSILDICQKEKIDGVISLIDPELELLAKYRYKFDRIDTKLICSSLELLKISFNKYSFYKELSSRGILTQPTYLYLSEVKEAMNNSQLQFPVFVKPNKGSASVDIQTVYSIKILEELYSRNDIELISQEFIDGKEYGIDVYVDFISKEVISIFIKEKLKMRAGETDKSISVKNDSITNLIKTFVETMGYVGPLDIDLFERNGQFYISEVNPRFGGGYLHAYLNGCNFPYYIIQNLKGEMNQSAINDYEENTVMMKYNEVKYLEGE